VSLTFLGFPANVGGIRKFFSLKPSLLQGNRPSKFQLIRVRCFEGVRRQYTNTKQTNSLTSYCFRGWIFFYGWGPLHFVFVLDNLFPIEESTKIFS